MEPIIRVKFHQNCVVNSVKVDLEQQFQLIDRQISHSDLPPLYVTVGCADVNFKNPDQITKVRVEEVHGEVIDVHFVDGELSCCVFFNTTLDMAEVLQNNDVYLSALYTMIDDRVINLIRMYANIKTKYPEVK